MSTRQSRKDYLLLTSSLVKTDVIDRVDMSGESFYVSLDLDFSIDHLPEHVTQCGSLQVYCLQILGPQLQPGLLG